MGLMSQELFNIRRASNQNSQYDSKKNSLRLSHEEKIAELKAIYSSYMTSMPRSASAQRNSSMRKTPTGEKDDNFGHYFQNVSGLGQGPIDSARKKEMDELSQ